MSLHCLISMIWVGFFSCVVIEVVFYFDFLYMFIIVIILFFLGRNCIFGGWIDGEQIMVAEHCQSGFVGPIFER